MDAAEVSGTASDSSDPHASTSSGDDSDDVCVVPYLSLLSLHGLLLLKRMQQRNNFTAITKCGLCGKYKFAAQKFLMAWNISFAWGRVILTSD